MVLRKDKSRSIVLHQMQESNGDVNIFTRQKHDSALLAAVVANSGNNSSFMEAKAKKNELLYPISPYDEIPTIRNLFKQLSPTPRRNSGVQRIQKEMRQEFSDKIKKNYSLSGCQQRDPVDVPKSFSRFRDDAHEVPIMIEMPTVTSFSEDSELSSEEYLRCYEEDYRDQHSLAPHPSYEHDLYYHHKPLDDHHLYHASVKIDHELTWPSDEDNVSSSDEDNVSPIKATVMTKNHKNNAKTFHRCHRFRLA